MLHYSQNKIMHIIEQKVTSPFPSGVRHRHLYLQYDNSANATLHDDRVTVTFKNTKHMVNDKTMSVSENVRNIIALPAFSQYQQVLTGGIDQLRAQPTHGLTAALGSQQIYYTQQAIVQEQTHCQVLSVNHHYVHWCFFMAAVQTTSMNCHSAAAWQSWLFSLDGSVFSKASRDLLKQCCEQVRISEHHTITQP